jgi:TetR/AcrR family transcriptional regulator, ethionamide resistance regulator
MPTDTRRAPRRNPARPQPRGEQRKVHLLDALASQLQHQSLADVSVAEVADQAGVGRSAFYFYFRGKHEAVTHLLEDIFVEQVSGVTELINAPGDPRANLDSALSLVVESWCSQRTLFLAMLDARDSDTGTRTVWEAWLRRYEDFATEYVSAHAATCPVEARDLAHGLISLNERVLERHLRSGSDDSARVHATLVHIWTTAIFGGTR